MQFVLRVTSQFDDKCAQGGGINLSHPVRVCSVVVERVTGTPISVLIINKTTTRFATTTLSTKAKARQSSPRTGWRAGKFRYDRISFPGGLSNYPPAGRPGLSQCRQPAPASGLTHCRGRQQDEYRHRDRSGYAEQQYPADLLQPT